MFVNFLGIRAKNFERKLKVNNKSFRKIIFQDKEGKALENPLFWAFTTKFDQVLP